jgi:type VI secretion system Hcp family effector
MTSRSTLRFLLPVLTSLILAATAAAQSVGGKSPGPVKADKDSSTVRIVLQIPSLSTSGATIDVFSYDQQTTNTQSSGSGGGGGAGKVDEGPVTVSKRIDAFTPALNNLLRTGQHIPELTLRWFRGDGSNRPDQLILTIKLTDVFISSIHTRLPNQQDPNSTPGETEDVSFTFKQIDITAGGA